MAQEQRKEPKNASVDTAPVESAGVEGLIGRLRDEGIAQGRKQAEEIIAAAEQRAADIVAAARQEGEAILARSSEEAAKLKTAGKDAIRLAMRDTTLAMEGDLIREFLGRLQRMVKGALVDPVFLQRLILEVAGRTAAAAPAGPAQLLLPEEIVSLDDLRRKPEEARPGTLMHFVLSMGGGMLRDGMSFGVADDGEAGIRVRLVNEHMQIDLTEGAISRLLLRHMLPRFRALLRGVATEPAGAKQAAQEKKAA